MRLFKRTGGWYTDTRRRTYKTRPQEVGRARPLWTLYLFKVFHCFSPLRDRGRNILVNEFGKEVTGSSWILVVIRHLPVGGAVGESDEERTAVADAVLPSSLPKETKFRLGQPCAMPR